MKVYHGSYTGDGVNPHAITGVGFQPDLVLIRRIGSTDVGTVNAYWTTSAMSAGNAVTMRADTAYETGIITSIDTDGFTVTDSASVNYSGDSYYYLAVKDNGAGDFKVGVYTGDGNDGLKVTGLGFRPDYVFIHSNSAIVGAHTYSSSTSSNIGFMAFSGANRSDLFASLNGGGFTVNNGSASGGNLINVSATEHSYFAFKAVPRYCAVQEYTGNATDDRSITLNDALLTPVFALVKGDTASKPVMRLKQNSGDQSQEWENSVTWSDCIQSFGLGTMQIGADNRVNANSVKFSILLLADNFTTHNGGFFQFMSPDR